MSKFVYKNNRKRPKATIIISYILFAVIALWLLASIYYELSPVEIIKRGFSSVGSKNVSIEELEAEIVSKDSIIASLKAQLNQQKTQGSRKAIVKVSGNTLNLRSQASLISDVILQIPAESQVDIMFYDTETYYLEGKAGKWCKIRYSGQEGWVWGNFLLEIE